ncbi:hypothetical protein [Akkermansia muciniphila]|uniref:hypothetical protein n=1 Tax=Akkermansia muciniphila TaxID=239935 RepID=UPI0004F32F43|nr:hypothetical protein [Akkermansia muciniphila]
MKYVSFLCVLFSGLLSTVALGEPDRYSHVATQAEVEQDSFLRGTARNLEKSDVVLSVIIYKIVSTDQGTTLYARVVQSLRGDIPVEALVKWNGHANKLPKGSAPKTELYSSCNLSYVLASSKEVKKLLNTPEDFTPADNIYGLDSYSLGDHVRYFPMTESDPGRAMKKLLHIEPAKITAESEAARFQPESGE